MYWLSGLSDVSGGAGFLWLGESKQEDLLQRVQGRIPDTLQADEQHEHETWLGQMGSKNFSHWICTYSMNISDRD